MRRAISRARTIPQAEMAPDPMTETAALFAEEIREAEARFTSAGLHYPALAVTAAQALGLTSHTFFYANTRFVFDVTCAAADAGVKCVTLWMLKQLNAENGYPLPGSEQRIYEFYWLEALPTGLERWADLVAEGARRRDLAHWHLAEAEKLLAGYDSMGALRARLLRDHSRIVLLNRKSLQRKRKFIVHAR